MLIISSRGRGRVTRLAWSRVSRLNSLASLPLDLLRHHEAVLFGLVYARLNWWIRTLLACSADARGDERFDVRVFAYFPRLRTARLAINVLFDLLRLGTLFQFANFLLLVATALTCIDRRNGFRQSLAHSFGVPWALLDGHCTRSLVALKHKILILGYRES